MKWVTRADSPSRTAAAQNHAGQDRRRRPSVTGGQSFAATLGLPTRPATAARAHTGVDAGLQVPRQGQRDASLRGYVPVGGVRYELGQFPFFGLVSHKDRNLLDCPVIALNDTPR